MSEEVTMEQNLTNWINTLRRMRKLAIEMQSPEQDGEWVTSEIRAMYNDFQALEPDQDGLCDSYRLTFADPDSKRAYLELHMTVNIKDDSE